MPVCLHCGELGPEGALFCPKCGYTLPQVEPVVPATPTAAVLGATPGAATAPPRPVSVPPVQPIPTPAPSSPYGYLAGGPPLAYVTPIPAGAAGPIPPPPSAKYCNRCRTLISRAAVYCPVCQQPQA